MVPELTYSPKKPISNISEGLALPNLTKGSSTVRVAVFKVVALPSTIKSPVTVSVLPIVTSFGKPIVIEPLAELTSTSLAVPVRLVTPRLVTVIVLSVTAVPTPVPPAILRVSPLLNVSEEPVSAARLNDVDIDALAADVILPKVSTVNTGILVVPPYVFAVTPEVDKATVTLADSPPALVKVIPEPAVRLAT